MTKKTGRVLRGLVISLAALAISRGGVVHAATLPVATAQKSVEQGLRTPTRVTVGADGSLYVADPANRGVLKFDASGKLVRKYSVKGIPQGLAITASGQMLVSQREFVSILDASGAEVGKLGAGNGQFVLADDIAIDDAGKIYVSDSKGACVQVFDASGAYLTRFGAKGSGAGQFRYPTAIVFEKNSKQLAVVDSLNGQVQFYDQAGVFVRSIGGTGSGPLKFMHPKGLAFEYVADGSIRMYVSDSMLQDIQVIDPAGSGSFLATIGASHKNELFSPSDLAFDAAAGKLYVVDGHGSVSVYAITNGSTVVNTGTGSSNSATVVSSSGSSATTGGSGAAVTGAAPFIVSTVSSGSSVNQALLDLTGTVSGISSISVNGQKLLTAKGLFSAAVPLNAGANDITLTAVDTAGNTWQEVRTVTLDATVPALTVSLPDVVATSLAQLTITGSVDRAAYVSVSGVPANTSSTEWSSTITLTPGINTVEIQAIDLTGLAGVEKRTIIYTPSAPEITIASPAEDLTTTEEDFVLSGTATAGTTVTAQINGKSVSASVTSGKFRVPFEFETAGTYTFTVTAADDSGKAVSVNRTIIYKKKS